MVMWVCEALEMIEKGLRWKSWSVDGHAESISTYTIKVIDSAHPDIRRMG